MLQKMTFSIKYLRMILLVVSACMLSLNTAAQTPAIKIRKGNSKTGLGNLKYTELPLGSIKPYGWLR